MVLFIFLDFAHLKSLYVLSLISILNFHSFLMSQTPEIHIIVYPPYVFSNNHDVNKSQ